MAAERLSMRKIREVLRLHAQGWARRQIARSVGVAHSTIREYLRRAEAAGLSWPLPPDLTDSELEARLFPPPKPSTVLRPLPVWSEVYQELRKKGVTLQLVWLEYKEQYPDGLQYSQFCERFRQWKGTLDLVLRQEHRAGEKVFVDFAGQTVPVVVQRHPLLRSWETASFTHPVLQFCCDFTSFPAGEGLPACCRSSPSSSRSR